MNMIWKESRGGAPLMGPTLKECHVPPLIDVPASPRKPPVCLPPLKLPCHPMVMFVAVVSK